MAVMHAENMICILNSRALNGIAAVSNYSEDEFRDAIGRWIKMMFASQKSAAKSLHVSEQYLSDFLTGKRAPGKKLLSNLHAKRMTTYKWG